MLAVEEESPVTVEAEAADSRANRNDVLRHLALHAHSDRVELGVVFHLPELRILHVERRGKPALAACRNGQRQLSLCDNLSVWRLKSNYDPRGFVLDAATRHLAADFHRCLGGGGVRRRNHYVVLIHVQFVGLDLADAAVESSPGIPARDELRRVGLDEHRVLAPEDVRRNVHSHAEVSVRTVSARLVVDVDRAVAHDAVEVEENPPSLRRRRKVERLAVPSCSRPRQLGSARVALRIERTLDRPIVRNGNRPPVLPVARKLPAVVEVLDNAPRVRDRGRLVHPHLAEEKPSALLEPEKLRERTRERDCGKLDDKVVAVRRESLRRDASAHRDFVRQAEAQRLAVDVGNWIEALLRPDADAASVGGRLARQKLEEPARIQWDRDVLRAVGVGGLVLPLRDVDDGEVRLDCASVFVLEDLHALVLEPVVRDGSRVRVYDGDAWRIRLAGARLPADAVRRDEVIGDPSLPVVHDHVVLHVVFPDDWILKGVYVDARVDRLVGLLRERLDSIRTDPEVSVAADRKNGTVVAFAEGEVRVVARPLAVRADHRQLSIALPGAVQRGRAKATPDHVDAPAAVRAAEHLGIMSLAKNLDRHERAFPRIGNRVADIGLRPVEMAAFGILRPARDEKVVLSLVVTPDVPAPIRVFRVLDAVLDVARLHAVRSPAVGRERRERLGRFEAVHEPSAPDEIRPLRRALPLDDLGDGLARAHERD